jgi:hypothetical protein
LHGDPVGKGNDTYFYEEREIKHDRTEYLFPEVQGLGEEARNEDKEQAKEGTKVI